MLGVYINAMNEEGARDRYNRKLARQIRESDDDAALYRYLIEQHSSGALSENQSFDTLIAIRALIPLKNGLGEIVRGHLFVCDQPEGYFPVKLIQRRVAHRECEAFARWLGCEELSGIHYGDLDYREPLTADDVEALQDEYFANSSGLLLEFYQHGQLSDELMMQYGNKLEYLTLGRSSDEDDESYEFPAAPVMNWESLRNHVREQWEDPIRVVSLQVLYTVRWGQRGSRTFTLNSEEDRQDTKKIYAHGKCFCQMCGKVKNYGFIEVNNLELLPEYYFPQLRVALCLECSKRFKSFRQNEGIRRRYLEAIQGADTQDQEKVIIPVGMGETFTFTATHLAEIQEILRQRPR